MKIAFINKRKYQIDRIYYQELFDKISAHGDVAYCIKKKSLEKNKEFWAECEYAFSTWDMMKLSKEEVATYFPKLKALFYAAGTVQYFAKPFLENGVKIFSAAEANGIPVAEYTFAQIILAAKGYFQAAKTAKRLLPISMYVGKRNSGNYHSKIGLVGLGAIGRNVAERLRTLDVEVYGHDAFVTQEQADKYKVKLVDIETLFKTCDVISNHLANKSELKNFFNRKLFKLMKKNASFINTGRGAQVSEFALAMSLIAHPGRTAILDVLKNEFVTFLSPLWWCPNCILTPHIAGSTSFEVTRMGDFMYEEFISFLDNKPTPNEVTMKHLERMA